MRVSRLVRLAAATGAIPGALKATVGLHVSLADEVAGVDRSEHGEDAYPGGGVGDSAGHGTNVGDSVLIPPGTLRPVTTAPPRAVARVPRAG